eukprot:6434967-Pyramimonas_sp.AAC.1
MFMWMRDTPEKKPNITPQKHMIRSFGPSRSTPSPLPAPGGAKDELLRKAKAAAAVPPTKAEVREQHGATRTMYFVQHTKPRHCTKQPKDARHNMTRHDRRSL